MQNLLSTLKHMKIWLCWNFKTNNHKKAKHPISALGEPTGTNEKYKNTLVTYEEAVKSATENNYDGVGFVIPEGYFFLDIDHRQLNDPFVIELLERYDSYVERSISGDGLHIYGKCNIEKLPTIKDTNGNLKLDPKYYLKNPNNGIELYIGKVTNRFAVFTENVIKDKPLKDCTEAVLKTLEEDMLRTSSIKNTSAGKSTKTNNSSNISTSIDVDKIINKLRGQNNSSKFIKLFENGDFSDYGSQSEADLALCCMIAFRAGDNPELIDDVFRKSALYREKWNRSDYRNETIKKSINLSVSSNFSPSALNKNTSKGMTKSSNSIPPFISHDKKGNPIISEPLLAMYVRDKLNYLLVRSNGNQSLLTYVYIHGVYVLCDELMFKGFIKKFVEDYDPTLVKMRQINEVYNLIITDVNCYKRMEDLNSQENIINFKNGILIVTENELKLVPHNPKYYSTIQIPCNWTGQKSETPVFKEYIKTLTNGDKGTCALLLQFIGVCLSNVKGHRMKKILFLVGKGDNGKSQLKALVERILGPVNCVGIDLSELEERFGTSTIYGVRLAGSSDMSFMTIKELKTLKKLSGGDCVFVEFKGKTGFGYTYRGLLWFCMNQLPKFGGDQGEWVYNRIMVVHCPNVIPIKKQDKELLDKMFAEREGIVYLAIKNLQKVIKNGYRFDESESIKLARKDYMFRNNSVVAFIDECMCPRGSNRISDNASMSKLYDIYKAWCRDNNGGFYKSQKEFHDELVLFYNANNYKELITKIKGRTYLKDYTLTTEAKDLYQHIYINNNVDIEKFDKDYHPT